MLLLTQSMCNTLQEAAKRGEAARVALDAQHEEIFGTPRRHDPSEDSGFDGCMVRGCTKPVEQPEDLFCVDHAIEIGMNRNEVEGAVA